MPKIIEYATWYCDKQFPDGPPRGRSADVARNAHKPSGWPLTTLLPERHDDGRGDGTVAVTVRGKPVMCPADGCGGRFRLLIEPGDSPDA